MRILNIVDVSAVMRTFYRPLDNERALSVMVEGAEYNTTHLYGLFKIFKTYGRNADYIFAYDTPINYLKGDDPKGAKKAGIKYTQKNYKKGRKRVEDDYFIGYNLGKESLIYSGFKVLSVEGFEADHLIIQAHKELSPYYDHTNIITNDQDLAITVDTRTEWVNTIKRRGNITRANYEKKLKCPYNSIHLKKALVGDPSDNLKGAKGFGIKSFEKLVEKEKLYEINIQGQEKELIEYTDMLTDTQKVDALKDLYIITPKEVPINLEMQIPKWDKLKKIFTLFQMKSLMDI